MKGPGRVSTQKGRQEKMNVNKEQGFIDRSSWFNDINCTVVSFSHIPPALLQWSSISQERSPSPPCGRLLGGGSPNSVPQNGS